MVLEVEGLTKRYGKVTALDQVSFKLSGSGIIGFVGANGAGKTTALRIMSGLEEPDAGDIKLDGVSIIDYPDKMRRKIGFMPDTLPDASDITVKEYLNFFVNSFVEKSKRAAVMAEVAEFTGVDTFLNRKLSDLSKGMKQRVSLARLQIHDPDLMLLDEPAAGLDPRARAELHAMLKKLADKGKMIFLSSHILAELENMVSGVVIIDKGKVLQHGTLSEVAASGIQDPGVERVITGTRIAVSDAMLNLIKEFKMVRGCRRNGLTCEFDVISSEFSRFLSALGEVNFPLVWLRRAEKSVELEKLFLEVTGKENK
jgi:ABC-2 type transport system ATP-binding protein